MTAPRVSGRSRQVIVVAAATGLVVTVVGTFLPWLGSGRAERDSYAAGGAARRLLTLSRPVHDLLGAWPGLGLVAGVALALLLLGHLAAGLGTAFVASVVAGGCALAVLPVQGTSYAHVILTGPVITLIGAMLSALTSLITLGLAVARRPQ